jgi:hypothetical protein
MLSPKLAQPILNLRDSLFFPLHGVPNVGHQHSRFFLIPAKFQSQPELCGGSFQYFASVAAKLFGRSDPGLQERFLLHDLWSRKRVPVETTC